MTSEPKSLLLVTHYFPAHGGGVESVAGELARRLLASGDVRITWLSSDLDQPPELPGLVFLKAPAWNALEYRFEVPVPIWGFRTLRLLWRKVGSVDVVHIHDTLYPGNAAAALFALVRGKPLLVTQHVGYVPYRNRLLRLLVSLGNHTLAAWLLVRARQAVFISAAVQAYFSRHCSWRRSPRLIPNGVDTDLYRPGSEEEREQARRTLDIAPRQPVFMFIGRFVEKKGLPLLKRLAARTPEASWLFAGTGPVDPEDWQLPNVRVFRNRRRESLRELLWASDLLLLPSETEGFPLVVQEAFACGVPALVTSDIVQGYPPSRDVLLHEPIGEGAEERWLVRIERCVRGLEAHASRDALAQFARDHWSWERTTRAYLDVIQEMRHAPGPSGRT